jgi:hypothetical protein
MLKTDTPECRQNLKINEVGTTKKAHTNKRQDPSAQYL